MTFVHMTTIHRKYSLLRRYGNNTVGNISLTGRIGFHVNTVIIWKSVYAISYCISYSRSHDSVVADMQVLYCSNCLTNIACRQILVNQKVGQRNDSSKGHML